MDDRSNSNSTTTSSTIYDHSVTVQLLMLLIFLPFFFVIVMRCIDFARDLRQPKKQPERVAFYRPRATSVYFAEA